MSKAPVDVILMDVYMGSGGDGMAATRLVVEKWPEARIAVISASVDARVGAASKRAGAHTFIPKAMPVSEMVSAIRRVAAAAPVVSANGARPRRASGLKSRIGGLSPRQRQVLEQIRIGRTNREIAARLGISIATVNKHVHEVLTVLKVRNRTQAAAVVEQEVHD
jgi:NarL family two-component system response regulator LiaR